MAIIDRIKYDGDPRGGQWLVHKCPSEQFVLGSQLIVNQGQEALFFKGGEALDLFGPGTHTLTTGNLPLLNKLVNLPFGGKTPFSAEIYYVNKTANLDLKWGTATPIPLEDPKYGLILNVGARGQYGITINDSRLFVSRIIGAVPNGTTADHLVIIKYFNGLINAKIKSVAAEYMVKEKISFLEISQYLSELSDAFKEQLNDEFERFGIELSNFYCESIAPRPEEYKKLREYKEELALGEGFYQQRRSLDILEKLADNPSTGGIANAGIGLGMGLGVAPQMGNLFSGLGQNVQSGQTQTIQPSGNQMQSAQSGNQPPQTVTCPKCGAENSALMKFCGSCGSSLITSVTCPYCGAQVPAGMKFCGECGKPLSSLKCPSCGFENKAGMKFCGNCGQKLV